MTKVTIETELVKRLHNLTTPLEFCDEHGNVLARYTPSTPWNDPENWMPNEPVGNEQESAPGNDSHDKTYSTEEIIDMLKAL